MIVGLMTNNCTSISTPIKIGKAILFAYLLVPTVAIAQAITQPNPTIKSAKQARATIIAVKPIYEDIVIGKDCQLVPIPSSADPATGMPTRATTQCTPIIQSQQTAISYTAEYQDIRFSRNTFRMLEVGDTVKIQVITFINPSE